MADILIKGLTLPKDRKRLTVTLFSNGDVAVSSGRVDLYTKAIELPSHGDLIDRNELPIIGITDYKLEGHTVVEFEDVLNAPVILEASNKKETSIKARICPHYQGVCGLDEDFVCYCSMSYEFCDKYREASK